MRKLLITVAVLSVSVVTAAGCGNDREAASGASELVPAGAVIYGEANLKPEGDQKEAIDSILSKFPGGGEAGDKLKDLIEKGLRKSDAPISFKKDIEPWLGDEAAFFATFSQADQRTIGAGLIATDDENAARDALEKSAEGKTQQKSYKDVDYLIDESGDAGAVFNGFVVLGNEESVKAAIDTSKGGKKLSDDEDYKKAVDGAASDRLGLFYANSPEILRAAEQTGSGALPDSFKQFLKEPVLATADADKDGVTFEGKVPSELGGGFALFGESSKLLPYMPGDSWLALAQKDLGKLLDLYVDAFASAAGGRDAIEQQFKAATGLDLQKQLAWMGDFGVFVRGSSLTSLDGALIVETSDEAESARFLSALERLIRTQAGSDTQIHRRSGGFTIKIARVPKPIEAFVQSGKVVFAYGDAAAKDAVDATDKLGDSPDFTSARDSLGDYNVSAYVLMKPILDLVDSSSAANDADWQRAKPYLEPITALVSGTSGSGDDLKSAFKLIVK
jgi:hypothetical protein